MGFPLFIFFIIKLVNFFLQILLQDKYNIGVYIVSKKKIITRHLCHPNVEVISLSRLHIRPLPHLHHRRKTTIVINNVAQATRILIGSW